MTVPEVAWALGRFYMGLPTRAATRPRAYGLDRVPKSGGAVYAINMRPAADAQQIDTTELTAEDVVARIEELVRARRAAPSAAQ